MEFDFAIKGTISRGSAPKRWIRGGKRCSKGKSCRSTCIHRGLICQVELSGGVSKALSRIKLGQSSLVAAHPSLKKDFTDSNLKKALKDMESLDSDAGRRVRILAKLFGETKTVFLDWKDHNTNRKVFSEFVANLPKEVMSTYDGKVVKPTWVGLAFKEGATIVRTSAGFNPVVKQIKKLVETQITKQRKTGELPFAIGKGTKASGNNSLVTLVHELGHHAHYRTRMVPLPKNLKTVSIYGDPGNQKEQFAELFTAYMFSGPRLKELYPYEYGVVEDTLSRANLL